MLVPSLHFESPNPHVPFNALGLRVQRKLESWPGDNLALAGVSSSGYGGVNVHVAMEAPPALPGGHDDHIEERHLFTLSARSAVALKQSAALYAAHLASHDDLQLAGLCFTAGAGRTQFNHRLAMIVGAKAELRSRLDDFANGRSHPDILQGTAKRIRGNSDPAHTVAASADLVTLAAKYVSGATLDWQQFGVANQTRRCHLPTYPFQRQRYWIAPSTCSIIQSPSAEIRIEARSENPQRDIVPPTTDVEKSLALMWQSILGVNPIGVTDDFFALGGASLMAVEFFVKVEKEFGVSLDPRTLFECPTIERLAPHIQSQSLARPAPLLVPIRPTGTRPPIFLIAPDHLFHYTPLSRLLDSSHPLYGLQPPFADGFRCPDMTIEQMAQAYLTQFASICPSGECHLIGLCAGGVIAYEMAQRLRASGRRIGLLAMLDTPCPPSDRLPPSGKWQYRLMRTAAHMRNLSRLGLSDAVRYLLVRSRLLLRSALPAHAGAHKVAVASSLASIANRAAIYRYRPEPYRGTVDLFMANEPYPSLREDTRHRWSELAPDTRTHRVPGMHEEMLRNPQAIAELINTELNRAETKTLSIPTQIPMRAFDNTLRPTG
jgi:thioesterase domain-containing protein/acyl carrier protein